MTDYQPAPRPGSQQEPSKAVSPYGQSSPYSQPASQNPYTDQGRDQSGYHQSQPNFNQPQPHPDQQAGYQQPGYGQAGYQQPGYDQAEYQQPGYGQPGYQQPGYGQQGGYYPPAMGIEYVTPPIDSPVPPPYPPAGMEKSQLVTVLLAFFTGSLGLHNFYLGRTGTGMAQLLITLLSLGLLGWVSAIWAFVEMILYLASSSARWKTDGRGYLLKK